MIKNKLRTVLTLLFILLYTQCIFTNLNKVQAAQINVKSKTLQVGYGMKLNIIGANKKVTWVSDDKDIAKVSGSGYVTAKKVGKTTIRAKVNNKSYKCKINVNQNAHVEVYNTRKLPFTGIDLNVKYKSSNIKIATVDKTGKVTGKKVGNVKITAKVNGKKFSYNLIVDASRLEKRRRWKYILL